MKPEFFSFPSKKSFAWFYLTIIGFLSDWIHVLTENSFAVTLSNYKTGRPDHFYLISDIFLLLFGLFFVLAIIQIITNIIRFPSLISKHLREKTMGKFISKIFINLLFIIIVIIFPVLIYH